MILEVMNTDSSVSLKKKRTLIKIKYLLVFQHA